MVLLLCTHNIVRVQQVSTIVTLLGEPCLWLRLLAEMQVVRQS